ncbi:MAG: outer membrane beta-barrel protein [Cyclobacteriaceae bacterium]
MRRSIIFLRQVLLALLLGQSILAFGQATREQILREGNLKSTFDKSFHWGGTFNQYWSTIQGPAVSDSYFAKPSIGGNIRAEYFFNSFLGVGLAAGFQQRGAGLLNKDVTGGAFSHPWVFVDTPTGYRSGDPDSTHLERLRMSTLEFPLLLLFRTPQDIFQQGMRLSGAVGPTFIHTMRVNQTYQSVIDGFHPYNWVTDHYQRNLWGWQAELGLDIDAGGGSSLFKVHFVYTHTTGNVYAIGQGDGRSVTMGVRLGWMF